MEQILISGITLEEFIGKFEELLDRKLVKLNQAEAKYPEYLTRADVANLLKITLPTLHEWTKSGILQSYKIGNRVLYKLLDIQKIVNDLSTFKHKKYFQTNKRDTI